MGTLVMIGQLTLGLGLLVFIHELGHFLAARAFGVKVEKFFVFFDFNGVKIYSKKIGDTEYGIGWFPLGGYVKIAGMIDESMDLDQMEGEPQPWELRSRPAWQRLIVMLGGVIMNLILGTIIFTGILMYYNQGYIDPKTVKDGIYAYPIAQEVGLQTGDIIETINGSPIQRDADLISMRVLFGAKLGVKRDGRDTVIDLPDEFFRALQKKKSVFIRLENYPFTIDSVVSEFNAGSLKGKPTYAAQLGLQAGDKIIQVNDHPIAVFGDLRNYLAQSLGEPCTVTYIHGSDTIVKTTDTLLTPALGVTVKDPYYDDKIPYTLGSAIKFGAKDGLEAIYYNAVGLGKIFTGKVPASESVQSPLGIAMIYGKVWQWDRFWYLTGLISFILAFMNLLPIPALDGGHVMFILIEMVQGKPVSQDFMEKAQRVGIILLLGIMLFAFGNDIYKLVIQYLNK